MADTHIKFKLGSEYNGQGFKQVQEALKENGRELGAVKQGLGKVSTAFSDLSPVAKEATDKVGSFISAFKTGGIVGGVISLAIAGVALAIENVKEKAKECEERIKKFAQVMREELGQEIDGVSQSVKDLKSESKEALDEVEDKLKALNGEAAQQAQNKIYELHTETIEAIERETSEGGKALIQAMADSEEAQIKFKAEIEKTYNKQTALNEKLDLLKDSYVDITEVVKESNSVMVDAKNKLVAYSSKREELEAKREEVEQQYQDNLIDLKDYIKTSKQIKIDIHDLEEKYKPELDQLKQATTANKEALKAQEENLKQQNEVQKEIRQASEDLGTAERKYNEERAKATAAVSKANGLIEEENEKVEQANESWKDFLEAQRQKLEDAEAEHEDWLEREGLLYNLNKAIQNKTDDLNSQDDRPDGNNGNDDGNAPDMRELKQNIKDIKQNQTNGRQKSGATENYFNPINNLEKLKEVGDLKDKAAERLRNKMGSTHDFKQMWQAQKKVEQDYENRLKPVKNDYIKYLQLAGTPKKLWSKSDQEFSQIFKQFVIPQLSIEKNKQLFKEAGNHLLMSNDQKKFIGDEALEKWLKTNISDKLQLK